MARTRTERRQDVSERPPGMTEPVADESFALLRLIGETALDRQRHPQ